MEDNIVFRRVEQKDTTGLVSLFNIVWPNEKYSKIDKTQFVLNSNSPYNYCALSGCEIVGSRLSIKEPLYFGDVRLNSIQVCDTCTHPDFRGRRIMGRLNTLLLKEFFSAGGDIIFNIGENSSRRVNEHYGWQYVHSLHTLLRFNHPFKVLIRYLTDHNSISGKINWMKNNHKINVDNSLLMQREKVMLVNKVFHIKYTEDAMSWRLSSNSGITAFTDAAHGTILYKIGECNGLKTVTIGDVFLSKYDKKSFKNLLRSFCNKTNPDIIKTAVTKGHPLYNLFKSSFFFKYKILNLGFRVEDDKLRKQCLNEDLWAISTLDFDTF